MQYKQLLAITASSLIFSSTGVAVSSSAPNQALDQLRIEHPKLVTVDRSGQIHKILDKQLATGRTPIASAENFITSFSAALNVDAKEFVERGPFLDGHVEQPIMYNQETGEHKFTGVYYMQTADGLPVYGSRLMVLVRNINGFPAVSATTDLRDVNGYKAPKRLIASEAVALMSAAVRLGRGTSISQPELMVFAGTEEKHHEPTAALVFQATNGGGWDVENYSKLELVVDARTGEILYEKNLILHATGNVSGVATESSGADVCEPESAAGLPYAKVTLGGNTAYADANGDYTVAGTGTITSTLDGQWFDSQNQSGADASLSQNSNNPNFLHNDANNNEQYRAQVNGYLQSNIVRDFALSYAPAFPTIATQTSFPVKTGVSGTCNAFYDYSSINFYNAGGGCSNTAFSVIVHHEYGHHMVAVAGSGQGMYGEGMGDVLGVLITGDNQLARGFYSNDCTNGIRNAINNHQYPCSGEIHDCGQLISGCVWDILVSMEAAYPLTGHDIVSSLAVNSIMLHSGDSIDPTITTDWLVLDDDDGDVTNGTPHSTELLAGFAMHNMDNWSPPTPYACCINEVCSELISSACLAAGGVPRTGFSCAQVSCQPLANDFCDTAEYVTDGTWAFTTVDALNGSEPYNDAQCAGTFLGVMNADVWFSYIACETGSMTVSTCDSIDFDSDIVVYQGTCGALTQVACNGDGTNCAGYSSHVVFNVTQGAEYLFRVGGWDASSEGSGALFVDGPGVGCETNPAVVIDYPSGRPSLVDPNGGTVVAIDVTDGTSTPTDGTLNWNDGTGWNSVALGTTFDATFPAFNCGASVDWYVSINTAVGDVVLSPANAPTSTWNAMAYSGSEITFDDNFQTDMGWTVGAGASTGNWARVVPANGGARCDNPTDADGSGMCYVTGNGFDEDVDGGSTDLTSPPMEYTDSSILRYSRWYSNGSNCNGADPNNDYFYVDVSYDGGPWTSLEIVGPVAESSGGWYDVEHSLTGAGNVQVRFTCGDLNAGSVIEAAVDGVSLSRSFCDTPSCTGDVNGDNTVDVTDLLEVVASWGTGSGPADINGDGIVDVGDILELVGAWGACP
ncbi:MAG TPA: hypothetical protein EYM90_06425 [Phycisphaerales bacterium]|nr:hypothetical protein [Phycisphaerales bacterium]HIO52459.1 hypothetical protein [Phycisphaerales bacterium]